MKQLTLLVENKIGVLAQVASLLGGRGVNIESITQESFPDGAVIRIITRDSKTAKAALKKADFSVIESDILVLSILDRPGELGRVARKMALEKISVENIYLISKGTGKAVLALKVDLPEKAEALFKNNLLKFP